MMIDLTNKLQKKINLKFKNIELLKTSLMHKSSNIDINNEKLEFLGDRVLGLILSKKLLDIYPNEKEGIIDKKFANLVNKKTCLEIANKLELRKYMITGASYKGMNRSDDKIASDGLEALIGAIFLDQGLEVSEKFILNNWSDFLKQSLVTIIDAKTTLQEYSLKKFKTLPVYKISKQTGPMHNPIFKVEVCIINSKKFIASGNSKKSAQQNAAKKLLVDLKLK
jgi:ribonuclease-3